MAAIHVGPPPGAADTSARGMTPAARRAHAFSVNVLMFPLLLAVSAPAIPACDPGLRPCPPCDFAPPPSSNAQQLQTAARASSGSSGGDGAPHLRYLSFYGYDPREQVGWASLGITRNLSLVELGATLGFDHLLDVSPIFFALDSAQGGWRLRPDYRQRWQRQWASLRERWRQLRLIGVFLGDELVANGMPVAQVNTYRPTQKS